MDQSREYNFDIQIRDEFEEITQREMEESVTSTAIFNAILRNFAQTQMVISGMTPRG